MNVANWNVYTVMDMGHGYCERNGNLGKYDQVLHSPASKHEKRFSLPVLRQSDFSDKGTQGQKVLFGSVPKSVLELQLS